MVDELDETSFVALDSTSKNQLQLISSQLITPKKPRDMIPAEHFFTSAGCTAFTTLLPSTSGKSCNQTWFGEQVGVLPSCTCFKIHPNRFKQIYLYWSVRISLRADRLRQQGVCLLWQGKTPAPQVVTFADCTKSTAVCSGWFEESALLKRIFSHSLTCRALKNLLDRKADDYFTFAVFVEGSSKQLVVKLWWKSIHSGGLLSKISQAPRWQAHLNKKDQENTETWWKCICLQLLQNWKKKMSSSASFPL